MCPQPADRKNDITIKKSAAFLGGEENALIRSQKNSLNSIGSERSF